VEIGVELLCEHVSAAPGRTAQARVPSWRETTATSGSERTAATAATSVAFSSPDNVLRSPSPKKTSAFRLSLGWKLGGTGGTGGAGQANRLAEA